MKRYDMEYISSSSDCMQMVERPDGDWVDYDEAKAEIDRLKALNAELVAALAAILEIGKRDMTNPKYDGYFDEARAALKKARGE